jgi:coenzyme F420-reducing hydrogenase delta subunit/NAD-dependent dihydropyrimidine dehydrogenase PreA subunit
MKFARLKKWEHQLNACIRCGYCYEHCPLYKSTGWESDAPRAKLVLLFGLQIGQVEPSPTVAKKLFECFDCKRCEAVCSSGVPFTEILRDARCDLRDAGLDVDGLTSFNTDGGCARCLSCVRVCKHEARSVTTDRCVVVDRVKCVGCGACVEVCPRLTVQLSSTHGVSQSELAREMDTFLDGRPSGDAKAIVFCCNWSSYPGILNSRYAEPAAEEYKILVNMCAGRLPPQLIMHAFEHDAWGVLVSGCPDDECEHDGNLRARQSLQAFGQTLGDIGLDPRRIDYVEIPRGNPAKLEQAIADFMGQLHELGPLRQ